MAWVETWRCDRGAGARTTDPALVADHGADQPLRYRYILLVMNGAVSLAPARPEE